MGKVAIVGVEGSGKTVLMAGLCECFKQVPGSDEPYLMPENQAAFKFMETVPYMLRVKRQWPAATSIDNLRAMRWTYRFGDEILETVEMLDYPGELYCLAFGDAEEVRKEELDSKRDEVKKFLDHLIDADTLLVLLNLSDVINLGENHKNLETVWITRGILSYAKKLPNIKHTVLVFTQADRYAAELQAAGGPQGVYAKKLTMLKTLFPDQEIMAVSAVSSVEKNEQPSTDYSSSGCLDLMRVILADYDATIQTCLKNCEEKSRGLLVFQGDIEDLSIIVSQYLKSVEELKSQVLPLKKNYSDVLNAHIAASEGWLKFLNIMEEMLSPLSDQEKGDSLLWEGIRNNFHGTWQIIESLSEYYITKESSRLAQERRDQQAVETQRVKQVGTEQQEILNENVTKQEKQLLFKQRLASLCEQKGVMLLVYSSPYIADCDLMRVNLLHYGIECTMKNEFGYLTGLTIIGSVADFARPEIWVAATDYEKAMKIVEQYKTDSKPENAITGSEWLCAKCGETVEAIMGACWNCDTERPRVEL